MTKPLQNSPAPGDAPRSEPPPPPSSQAAAHGVPAVAADEPPLRSFRYRQTRADVAAFERLPGELVGREKLFLFGPALLCGMLWGVFHEEIGRLLPVVPRGPWAFPLAMFGSIIFSYGSSALMLSVRTALRIRAARLPQTDTVVDMGSENFSVTEDGRTRALAWRNVRVIEGDAHVFLCETARNAVILPLRAFEDAQTMKWFAQFAELAGGDASDFDDDDDDDDDVGNDDGRDARAADNAGRDSDARASVDTTRISHDTDTKGARP